MNLSHALAELDATERFFNRTTECLDEADASFAPVAGMMTVSQQVAHVASTVEWFVDGVFGGKGFDMDFEAGAAKCNAVASLAEARAWLTRAFAGARQAFGARTDAELAAPLFENPILQGPLYGVIDAIVDHTGHHRGALSVYARLRGKVPPMPYM